MRYFRCHRGVLSIRPLVVRRNGPEGHPRRGPMWPSPTQPHSAPWGWTTPVVVNCLLIGDRTSTYFTSAYAIPAYVTSTCRNRHRATRPFHVKHLFYLRAPLHSRRIGSFAIASLATHTHARGMTRTATAVCEVTRRSNGHVSRETPGRSIGQCGGRSTAFLPRLPTQSEVVARQPGQPQLSAPVVTSRVSRETRACP